MENPGMDFKQTTGSSDKLAKTAQIFHFLGTDCKKNIDIILEQTCSILDGAWSLYHRIDDKKKFLKVCAGHNMSNDLGKQFEAKGHICWEATIKGADKPILIHDLEATPFFKTDPRVQKYNLKSYLGFCVKLKETVIGSLCIADTKKRVFTRDEVDCIQTLAAALSLEEERLVLEKEFLEKKARYRIVVESANRDISRVKELEKKLLRAEKMELIGTMAGGVAHDLNNILSGLVSYPELLLMQIPSDSPLRESISFMHDSGLKAADIVQDLLTLTRRGISIESIINLNNVMHEYFHCPAHSRLKKNYPQIEFKTSCEADLLNICGSPSHLSKVIMNLVINAAEAIQKDGIVRVETFNQYIDLPFSGYDTILEGDYVVLRVTDDGSGISQDDLNRIFEPFYTKKQMGRSGSGLGLSVVWNCVKDHKGYIEVSSQKNKNTVFELYFPATRETTGKEPAHFLIDDFKGAGQTVLVIDDVDEQRKIARDSLKMLEYTPFTIESGEKALIFLGKHPVDLILLDMKMEPGIDGLETYKRILTINPTQKAIIASGFSENERVKETLKLGAGQYIKKPYTIKKLAHALQKELNSC